MIDLGMPNAAYDYLWLAMVLLVVVVLRLAFQMWRGRTRGAHRTPSASPRPGGEGPTDLPV